ncbi:MAG: hypothetical protein E6G06_02130 [Actinobacteria bacterium]|nr:MAG: hypothetical protein E6G06_02130 [Actinomycetota bacterium]
MATLDAAGRSRRSRQAAHVAHSRHSGQEMTAAARAANLTRFEGMLPEAERQRRAGHARKAYYIALAYKSAQVRRERAAAKAAS